MGFNGIYPLVMTNIAMERSTIFLSSVNHLFLWAHYTMAMLNNQRVYKYIIKNTHIYISQIDIQQIYIDIHLHRLHTYSSLIYFGMHASEIWDLSTLNKRNILIPLCGELTMGVAHLQMGWPLSWGVIHLLSLMILHVYCIRLLYIPVNTAGDL